MGYPAFFDQVPSITLYDPLGDLLGAFEQGDLEISYYDCTKLAGHSCPTVASAYLMAHAGLRALYPDTPPVRSRIRVELQAPKEEGVAGVIGNVVAYIVGAGDEGGFKGIGGVYARNNLLSYGHSALQGTLRLTDIDNHISVTLSADTSLVPGSPDMAPLMQKSMQGIATAEEEQKFQTLWQNRVKAILLDEDIQKKILTLTKENV